MGRFYFVILLILMLFYSCEKDKDEVYPTILFSSPTENSTFKVLEGVPIRAAITDNKRIDQVKISLIEISTGRRVLQELNFFPGVASYNLDEIYFLSDSLLNSAEYSIRIDASDGENTSSAFASFFIQGIPKKSLGLIAALDRGNSVQFIKLDANQNQTPFHSVLNCGELHISSKYQQLWYTMPSVEKIAVFNLRELRLDFETFPNSNGQSDDIIDALLLDDHFYVSTRRGAVQAFSPGFQDVFTYQSPSGFLVEDLYPISNRLMVREVDLQGNNQSLLYLFGNGAIDTRSSDPSIIVGFGSRSTTSNSAFQLLSVGNNVQVRDFNLESGLSSFLYEKPNLLINSLLQVSEYEYILLGNSQVYLFNISTNFLRSLASSVPSPKVAYDEVEKRVYIASGSQLSVYDYQQASLIYTSNLAFPIIDLGIHYNK